VYLKMEISRQRKRMSQTSTGATNALDDALSLNIPSPPT